MVDLVPFTFGDNSFLLLILHFPHFFLLSGFLRVRGLLSFLASSLQLSVRLRLLLYLLPFLLRDGVGASRFTKGVDFFFLLFFDFFRR